MTKLGNIMLTQALMFDSICFLTLSLFLFFFSFSFSLVHLRVPADLLCSSLASVVKLLWEGQRAKSHFLQALKKHRL